MVLQTSSRTYFWFCIGHAVIVYKEITQKKIRITEFKELLAVSLLNINNNPTNLEALNSNTKQELLEYVKIFSMSQKNYKRNRSIFCIFGIKSTTSTENT